MSQDDKDPEKSPMLLLLPTYMLMMWFHSVIEAYTFNFSVRVSLLLSRLIL